MIKCSKCDKLTRLRIVDTEYEKIGRRIIKFTTYKCDCGHLFLTRTYYLPETDEIIIDDNI